jgi:hypothetical protein
VCPPTWRMHRCRRHAQAADTIGVRNDVVTRVDQELSGNVALHVDHSLQATPEVKTKWGEIGTPRRPTTAPRPPTHWPGNYWYSHNLTRMLWLTAVVIVLGTSLESPICVQDTGRVSFLSALK